VHFCIGKSAKDTPMANISPAKFIREVRQEVGRVTWPTRKETMITTSMIMGIVFIAALFFMLVDGILSLGISQILGLGK
jgi:preprotein translocase subunit SecE